MKIDISFDAAEVLNKTTLKSDYPDAWSRYLENRVVRFGKRVGARVNTSVGRHDLALIRDYFCLWMNDQELLPAAERAKTQLDAEIRQAIRALTAVLGDTYECATRPADASV